MRQLACLSAVILLGLPLAQAAGQTQVIAPVAVPAPMVVPLSADAINSANMAASFAAPERPYILAPEASAETVEPPKVTANPAIVRAQILLDQFGASPGVIDGFDGENLRKAVIAFEVMAGLPIDGTFDTDMLARLETGQPVMGLYVITDADQADIVASIPTDYAEKAQMEFLGYTSVAEKLAERFHMDINLLTTLNPNVSFVAGDSIVVAITGMDRTGVVARIEADKNLRQVRAYDAQGLLLASYPATIGSEDNPSPSGSYVVEVVAPMPNYTYNPKINFQQGENTEVLTIPPGPNGPVGSMWIALSKPTYGIHGTPEPSQIDKTGSHGCVRLTNWDAQELAGMVAPGVTVDFL